MTRARLQDIAGAWLTLALVLLMIYVWVAG